MQHQHITEKLYELVMDPETIFIAHNAQFEKAIWRRVMVEQFKWPDIPNSRWHDTLAIAAMRALPQELDLCTRVLELSQEKDTEGSRLTKSLSKVKKDGYYDRSPETLAKVAAYCQQDIRTEVGLHQRLGWMPGSERAVWLLDQRINERGVRLDLEFVRAAQTVVDRASIPLVAEFGALTGGLKPGQRDKVLQWCQSQGVAVANMQKDYLAALLGETEDGEAPEDPFAELNEDIDPVELPDNVHRALSIKQLVGSASIKKLARMQACVCGDGRARGLLQYHGAGPGRWAGRLLQPQNFPRGTVKLDEKAPDPAIVVEAIMTGDPDYVESLIGPPVETVVGSLRHAIVADLKRSLVVGDFAGIEARIVLALAGQHDKTALMASGQDVYLHMAEDIYKQPRGSMNRKTHAIERQTGKNSVLGCGFQMGWRKFKARYCPEQPDEFAQQVIKAYREDWAPQVPKVWRGLEQAALKTVWDKVPHEAFGVEYRLEDGWMTARLPSGRKLWYFDPQKCRKAMPWSTDEDPDIRMAWTYKAMKLGRWRTIDAFGGLLTENVVQALARDLLVAAMFKCERNDLPVVLTVHDEIVAEALTHHAEPALLESIMCDIPQWAKEIQVPVSAECWAGRRYRK